jgi:hypothetical protein
VQPMTSRIEARDPMATITCGWCKDRCHQTRFGEVKVASLPYFMGEEAYVADAAFLCDGCGRMSVATWHTSYDPNDPTWDSFGRDGGPEDYESARWSPPVGHQFSFPDVPDEIADAAGEAWACHVTGAYRGAAMLARAVVESTAKAKDITTGILAAKIDKMAEQGLIRQAIAEQAHEIRHLGNSTAHGDLADPVTSEDSEEVLNLMGEVLNEVWQSPARSKRLAEQREAKRAQRQ